MNRTSCCKTEIDHREVAPLEAKISQNEIASLYNSLAPIYNIWALLTETKARKRAIELADLKDGQNVLEVAVGTGYAFEQIVRHNPSGMNIGIDLSAGMLRKAHNRLTWVNPSSYELKQGSAFNIPYPGETFDLIMNNYMFDLLPTKDIPQVLLEFKRVLKKGGKLVLVNMTIGERFGSGIYELIYRVSPRLLGGCRGLRLSSMVQAIGCDVASRQYYQQLLFPSEVILAKKPHAD